MAKVKNYNGGGEAPGLPHGYHIYLKVEVEADNLKADWNTLYKAGESVGVVVGAEIEKTG